RRRSTPARCRSSPIPPSAAVAASCRRRSASSTSGSKRRLPSSRRRCSWTPCPIPTATPLASVAEFTPSLAAYLSQVPALDPAPIVGHVTRVVGLLVESRGPVASVGEICEVRPQRGGQALLVEVVGFRDGRLLSVPLGDTSGISSGDRILARGASLTIPCGPELLGRVLDGLGRPIDGRGPISASGRVPLKTPAMNPMDRDPIAEPLGTGVRAIDSLLTCGRGQRLGIFGGSGVGKSTLLGMMARGTEA